MVLEDKTWIVEYIGEWIRQEARDYTAWLGKQGLCERTMLDPVRWKLPLDGYILLMVDEAFKSV